MTDHAFDRFTRHAAAAMSRRTSLTGMGAAVAAAMSQPLAFTAKPRKTARKIVKQKCGKGVQPCRENFIGQCADNPDPEECKSQILPCCEFLASCDVAGWFHCLFG